MTQKIVKTKFVGAYVEPRTQEQLRLLAKLHGVTMSAYLRQLISEAAERVTASQQYPQPAKEPTR